MHTLLSYRSFEAKIKEFYGFFSEHIEDASRQATEKLMEEALKAEIDILVDAERYERGERRRDYRNGHNVRQLVGHHPQRKIASDSVARRAVLGKERSGGVAQHTGRQDGPYRA